MAATQPDDRISVVQILNYVPHVLTSDTAITSFSLIAALDSAGILVHSAVDTGSDAYRALTGSGLHPDKISVFRYPDLPTYGEALFLNG